MNHAGITWIQITTELNTMIKLTIEYFCFGGTVQALNTTI